MNKQVTKLGALTLVFFFISLTIYHFDNRVVTGVKEGSYFISGIDSQKIFQVEIYNNDKTKISFDREGNGFLIASHNGYIADNSRINDLLFKISNIRAQKKISSSSSDQEAMRVSPNNYLYKVLLTDKGAQSQIEFFIGKNYLNKANYIRLAGKDEIYISDATLSFSTQNTSYVNKKIFNIGIDDVAGFEYKGKDKFIATRDPKSKFFTLSGKELENINSANIKNDVLRVTNIRFKEYLSAKEAVALALTYDIDLKINLENKSQVLLSLGKKKENYYLRARSNVEDMPNQIQLSRTDGKEKLKSVEDLINAKSQSSAFNLRHGAWVYKISKQLYESMNYKMSTYLKKKI